MLSELQAYCLTKMVEGVPLRVTAFAGREYPELDPYLMYGVTHRMHLSTLKALRRQRLIQPVFAQEHDTYYEITQKGRVALTYCRISKR